MSAGSADTASAVRSYYETNTPLFLRIGIGRRAMAIRRAVWAKGVTNLAQAVDYVNSLIAAEVRSEAGSLGGEALRILDIGCGVGGSLFYLARNLQEPMRAVGVTLSPRQAAMATRHARAHGLSGRCSFHAADFSRMRGGGDHHLALAIESFGHFQEPAAFFGAAARALRPGGRLYLVDDFLSALASDPAGPRKMRRLVHDFRAGWILPSLCSVEQAVAAAAELGFRLWSDQDLSRWLSLSTPGPLASRGALRVMRSIPVPWAFWRSTVGSLALSACRHQRLVEYHFLVLEKVGG